jgi:hypothetical protein
MSFVVESGEGDRLAVCSMGTGLPCLRRGLATRERRLGGSGRARRRRDPASDHSGSRSKKVQTSVRIEKKPDNNKRIVKRSARLSIVGSVGIALDGTTACAMGWLRT